jgi:predicted small lipoprotein YifL
MRALVRVVVVAAAVALLAGCGASGPRLYPVSGRVEFDDAAPVRGGTIELVSVADGSSAIGRIDHEGNFRLSTSQEGDGAAAGMHKVLVMQGGVPLGDVASHAHGPRVAGKYARPETTDLQVEVPQGGAGDLRIVVKSE